MRLVRKVNSTYNQVNSNLQILQKERIIFDEHFGRMRVIRLNKENPRTKILLQTLKMLETTEVAKAQQKEFADTKRDAEHVRNKTYN